VELDKAAADGNAKPRSLTPSPTGLAYLAKLLKQLGDILLSYSGSRVLDAKVKILVISTKTNYHAAPIREA
jgi:hypothetical protein